MTDESLWADEYVVDCEYDRGTHTLISMAIVPLFRTAKHHDPQHEFYFEVGPLRDDVDPWLKEHVYPLLDHERLLSYENVQVLLSEFLQRTQPKVIHFDWPEDMAYLSEAIITGPGTRIEVPEQGFALRYHPGLDAGSAHPHHALYDARGLALSVRERLAELKRSKGVA